MIKHSLLFVLLLLMSPLIAQEVLSDTALLDQGNQWYHSAKICSSVERELLLADTISEKGRMHWKERMEGLQQAAIFFERLIEAYPSSTLIHKARNNAALVYTQIGQEAKAIAYYKTILASSANDKEQGGAGVGIMAEPYALYKNRACKQLAELFLAQKQYLQALKYRRRTAKYPYRHFCLNEYIAEKQYDNIFYSKCYTKLGKPKKALSYCLPYTIRKYSEDNYAFARLAVTLLRKQYDRAYLLEALEQSMDKAYVVIEKEVEQCFMDYMGERVELPFIAINQGNVSVEEVRTMVKATYFYELLQLKGKPCFYE